MEADTEDLPRRTHWLKLLVIGMSVFLMLASFALVAIGIMRLGRDASAEFAPIRQPLSAGCRIEQTNIAGDRLVLSVGGRDECRRIVILDLKSGRTLGEIDFPAP